ncbi:hypothetical protein [Thiothrix nivea]|uniref:Uncharacterized protein n=1 Tax=Thiothrix nivea (strain ATCC 35100 / DSM 5205 / JP2) TaxID=870187 RepID=A0A656HCV1_THINJ|nr:hypothetical protein [Thiothrix nivea]EIJ34002.1 hypothetical protein Thini_1399 [Thiothrix nivea DSM 5205]
MALENGQQNGTNYWKIGLRIIQTFVGVVVSFYASLLTIFFAFEKVNQVFDLPEKINKISNEIHEKSTTFENKVDATNKDIIQRLETVDKNIKAMDAEAQSSHTNSFLANGFKDIKIRKSDKRDKDQTTIYYDASSGNFSELIEDGAKHKYFIILKNENGDSQPYLLSKFRGISNKNKSINQSGTDITFEVSESIFNALGGTDGSIFLQVQAKTILREKISP